MFALVAGRPLSQIHCSTAVQTSSDASAADAPTAPAKGSFSAAVSWNVLIRAIAAAAESRTIPLDPGPGVPCPYPAPCRHGCFSSNITFSSRPPLPTGEGTEGPAFRVARLLVRRQVKAKIKLSSSTCLYKAAADAGEPLRPLLSPCAKRYATRVGVLTMIERR